MNIYYCDPNTFEYLGTREARIDPLETAKAGKPIYLTGQPYTTLEQPPEAGEHQKARWNGESWELVGDYRGSVYYNKDTGAENIITELAVTIPDGYPTQAPTIGMYNPQWNGTSWIETAIVYQGQKVISKADVDSITKERISNLGEEKAKTEKLIAGSGECPIWDAFVTARTDILQEGNAFVTANNLT